LWGFLPGRDIKIVHLTNAMLGTMCGGTSSASKLLGDFVATHAGRGTKDKRTAADLFGNDDYELILLGDKTPARLDDLRVALDAVLNQDGAFYANSISTPTLTQWRHLTNDPSDNGAGALIGNVMLADDDQAAAQALRDALSDETDAIYRLTQPLLSANKKPMPALPTQPDLTELFVTSGSLRALQKGFQRLALRKDSLGKLELLARAGRLAGLGLWLHLLNAGAGERRQTLLLCGPQPPSEVLSASHRGIALAIRQLRRHFSEALYAELKKGGNHQLSVSDYQDWAAELDNDYQERYLLELDQEMDAGIEPGRAACYALVTPAMRLVGSKKEGADKVAEALGRRLGLWPRYPGRAGRHLKPVAAVYDALVPALLEPGEVLRFREFWQRAADEFGLVCGARGNADLELLAKAGMRGITPAQLAQNARLVLQELSRQGYARTYADGEALISA
jgi:hypothetical protein